MSERFLYEVRPMRPIHIPGQERSKKPFVALLTKEEVKEYMQYGPVYRKYADPNKEMVRVTGSNIDSLHHTMPEDGKPNRPVSDIIPLEKAVEPVKVELPKEEEEPKKSNVEESTTPVVEEVETVSMAKEDINETVETTVEETSTEDIVTEDVVNEEEPDAQEDTNDSADVEESEKEEVVDEETSNTTEATVEDEVVEETTEEESSNDEETTETSDQSGENHQKQIVNNVQFSSKKKKHN